MKQDNEKQQETINNRLARIKHTILVLSGKGGVGKSTVSANLAYELAMKGKRVGILDVDIHGPSIPGMFGLEGKRLMSSGEGMIPVAFRENLSVISVAFLLEDKGDAVIWRGPMKHNVIKQFISDVEWGDLDYLIVDSPPGTGDEPLSVVQLIGNNAGAIVVTTPQRVSIDNVRKSISFCRKLDLNVLGIIENMSGYVCPHCGKESDIFDSGGGEILGQEMDVPFLGKIPIEANVVGACDKGVPYMETSGDTLVAKAFRSIVEKILHGDTMTEEREELQVSEKDTSMKLAIPMVQGKLSMHFGHCEQFVLIEMSTDGTINSREEATPPAHEPGVLPQWLHELGATHIISGGMGSRAQNLFKQNGIDVVVGAPQSSTPEELALAFINGTLVPGDNVCDH